jgi:hypothetical protein
MVERLNSILSSHTFFTENLNRAWPIPNGLNFVITVSELAFNTLLYVTVRGDMISINWRNQVKIPNRRSPKQAEVFRGFVSLEENAG